MDRDETIKRLKGIEVETEKGKTYRVGKEIGKGGSGAVFRLNGAKGGDRVAKFYVPPELRQGDPKALQRFKNETEFAKTVDHPYIIKLVDWGSVKLPETDEVPFYVMGRASYSFRELVPDDFDPEGLPRGLLILIRAMLGVAHFHKHGCFHRDLKPENILIFGEEHPRVSDFGIAHIEPQFIGKSHLDVATSLGERLMNRTYYAPEQAEKGGKVDHRADIFALGLMLYELIAGTHAFRPNRPDLASLDPALADFDRIIFENMAINDVNERYDSLEMAIADILRALASFVGSRSSTAITQEDRQRLRGYLQSDNTAIQNEAVDLARRMGPGIALPIATEFVGSASRLGTPVPEQNAFRMMGEFQDEKSLPILVAGLYGRQIDGGMHYGNAQHAANALCRFPDQARVKALELVQKKVLAQHVEVIVKGIDKEEAFPAVKRLYDGKLLGRLPLDGMHTHLHLLFKTDPDRTWDMYKTQVLSVDRNTLADQFIQFGNIRQVKEIRQHILEDRERDYYPRIMEGILRSTLPGAELRPEYLAFMDAAKPRQRRGLLQGKWKEVAGLVQPRLEEIDSEK